MLLNILNPEQTEYMIEGAAAAGLKGHQGMNDSIWMAYNCKAVR